MKFQYCQKTCKCPFIQLQRHSSYINIHSLSKDISFYCDKLVKISGTTIIGMTWSLVGKAVSRKRLNADFSSFEHKNGCSSLIGKKKKKSKATASLCFILFRAQLVASNTVDKVVIRQFPIRVAFTYLFMKNTESLNYLVNRRDQGKTLDELQILKISY